MCAAALSLRALISWLMPIPAEDGVNYLWMAERFAAGEAALAFEEVFPPLTSMLIAAPVALGLDPFRAGQLVMAIVGCLALVFIVRATDQVAPGFGWCAGCFAAVAPLPIRLGAEVYSEPLFVMFTAAAVWAGLRGAHLWLGLLVGLAFWVRPEAAVVVPAFILADRRAWRSVFPFGAMVLALACWRGWLGHGFRPIGELLEFVEARSVTGGGDLWAGVSQFVDNAASLPWLWVEAFGGVGLLAAWAILRGPRRGRAGLYWTLLFGVLVICGFLARRRFLVAWFAVAVPIAVAGFQALPPRIRGPVFWLVILSSLALCFRGRDVNRIAERQVGAHIAAHTSADDLVVTDMTRVLYYAGRRPNPPRLFGAEELIRESGEPKVRFVVLGSRRPAAPVVESALADEFCRAILPAPIEAAAADRGIVVLVRR